MTSIKTRRNFIKSLAVASILPAGVLPLTNSNNKTFDDTFPFKFKISLNVYSFNSLLREGRIDLFDVLDFCARYNFDAIDPTGYYFPGYPEVPGREYVNDFKRRAFLLGLDISGTGVRNDFTTPDAEARRADITVIKNWVKVAADMGSPHLRIFAGNNPHEGYSRDDVFKWMADDLKECCDYAKEYGVILALQNHNGFLKTSGDIARVFEMVDSEWLGLNLDIGSYRQGDPYSEIEKNIGLAVTWQIKENVWIDDKETPVDLVKLFRIIKKHHYRGYLPLETLGGGDPYKKVPVLLEKVRNALSIG